MDLDSMKYSELQVLAKALGLKANVKAEKLLKALKQHYHHGEKEEQEQNNQNNVERDEKAPLESVQGENITKECVTTRRGRVNLTKRKFSAIADYTVTSDVAECASEPAGPEQIKDIKRRKFFSTEDSDKQEPSQEQQATENEQEQIGVKAEAPVASETEKPQKAATVGKIPRLQKTKPLLKPVTPNFKKLHEAQFNKMESIDSFFQRRTKQMETRKNSKEVKTNPARTSLFSPAPANKKATEASVKRPAGKTEVLFRPSVLSTRRINVRFSEATFDNEHKRSLIKTPAHMSPCVASSTPQRPAAATTPKTVQPSALSSTKTSKPFLFTGNNSSVSTTPGTQKKQNFDLKASLSRPLSYKPHTGKLKPFGEVNKSLPSNPRQEYYKNHKVQSRDDRRTKIMEGRKNKKENLLGARRGLM